MNVIRVSDSDFLKYFSYFEPMGILDLCRDTALVPKLHTVLFIVSMITAVLLYYMDDLYLPGNSVADIIVRGTIKGACIYLNP
jgi:hypothetical protein